LNIDRGLDVDLGLHVDHRSGYRLCGVSGVCSLSRRHPRRSDAVCKAHWFRVNGRFRMVHRQHSHMSRAVNLDVVHRGEQDTAFQVLECGSEFDAT
jgi:hypothetical protein